MSGWSNNAENIALFKETMGSWCDELSPGGGFVTGAEGVCVGGIGYYIMQCVFYIVYIYKFYNVVSVFSSHPLDLECGQTIHLNGFIVVLNSM